jgi:tetratricopeptide (TPR) repeat protein
MDKRLYLSCLWPGLPELWYRGRLSSLPIAVAFAAALNFWLVARYLFPGLMPTGLVSMAFWVGALLWAVCVWHAIREMPHLIAPRMATDEPDYFVEAHLAYLADDLATAEELFQDVLAIEARDPPALLFLSAIYRRTGRLDSAELLLEEIERLETADRWFLEVAAEKKRLHRDQTGQDSKEKTPEKVDDPPLPEPAQSAKAA